MEAQELTNLLVETQDILAAHNLSLKNIKYILNSTGYIPVASFIEQAHNINYYAGFGTVHIDPTLCIVGATWWLARREYDGKEWWEFLKKPAKPTLKSFNYKIYDEGCGYDGSN